MMDLEVLVNQINQLKRDGLKTFTNCFLNLSLIDTTSAYFKSGEKSVVIIINDSGLQRLLFYTTDYDDLKNVLNSLPAGEYIIEQISRTYEDSLADVFGARFACLSRYSNKDISVFDFDSVLFDFDGIRLLDADESYCERIEKLLWSTFNPCISHLPQRCDIVNSIHNKEFVCAVDDDDNIIALLEFKEEKNKFYINQIVNTGEKKYIHAILQKKLKEYISHGGKYVYAWIEEDNIASLKFHAKYKMEQEQIFTSIYSFKV